MRKKRNRSGLILFFMILILILLCASSKAQITQNPVSDDIDFVGDSVVAQDTILFLWENAMLTRWEKKREFKGIKIITYPTVCETFPLGVKKCKLLSDGTQIPGDFTVEYLPNEFALEIRSYQNIFFTQVSNVFYAKEQKITEIVLEMIKIVPRE